MNNRQEPASQVKIPPFIRKLLDILEDERNNTTIKFDQEKKCLEIISKKKLERLLPKYFRHRNFESFSRQLNWYGFVKMRGEKAHIYSHSDLKRGVKLQSIKSRRLLPPNEQNGQQAPSASENEGHAQNQSLHGPSGKQLDMLPGRISLAFPFEPLQTMPMMMVPPFPWGYSTYYPYPQQYDYRFL